MLFNVERPREEISAGKWLSRLKAVLPNMLLPEVLFILAYIVTLGWVCHEENWPLELVWTSQCTKEFASRTGLVLIASGYMQRRSNSVRIFKMV